MDSYICKIADLAYYENEKQTIVNVDIQDEKIEMNCEVDGVCFSAGGEYYFEHFNCFEIIFWNSGLELNVTAQG